jgi:HEAT repeat protein
MSVAATWTFIVLLAVSLVVGAAIVATRAVRMAVAARRARLAAGPRRHLLALAADGLHSPELDHLVALPERDWRAVQPVAMAMLSKVRGEGLAAIGAVFERRGEIDRELRSLRARTLVRRARAGEVLGGVRCAAAVPGLIALLRDRHPEVRLVAVRALGRIGDPAAAGPLLDCLAGPAPAPTNLVTDALVQLGPGAGGALVGALGRADPRARLAALSALRLGGTIGAEERVAAVLAEDPEPEVRVAAARLLGRLGTGGALAPLIRATGPAQPVTVRAAACQALGELGGDAAVEPLLGLLAEAQYAVAHSAARALASLGEPARSRLSGLLDRDTPATAHAREALARAALQPAGTALPPTPAGRL